MTRHFQRELEKIKQMILSLGAMVEERVQMAIRAVERFDGALAEQIIRTDHEIDEMEVEIEEECLKAIALYQPVAGDLRFVAAVIKINNELERIGDQAVNIAQRVRTMTRKKKQEIFDYFSMADKARVMLEMSLDALVNRDADTAFKVLLMDDRVDEHNRRAYRAIKQAIAANRAGVGYLINLLLISRHLERLADHATNIAEEVIYMIEGEIVRHERM